MEQITTARTELEYVMEKRHAAVGRRLPRYDGIAKATGSAIFGTDINLPDMLHGKILRSRYPHAKLLHIDISRAARLPQVRAIITWKDAPTITYGFATRDQTLFARDRVLYIGQPIAAVAATTVEAAEEALTLIEVEYEELPTVTEMEEAMKPEAPLIHPKVKPAARPPYPTKNVASYTRVHRGNVQRGFESSDMILEESYATQRVHQSYLEPHAAAASVDGIGHVTVWTCSQAPFIVRAGLAHVLDMPATKIRVIGTHTGGGFGTKIGFNLEPFCVLLAKKAMRPVKIALTREEEFVSGNPRPEFHFWLKTGVKKDGSIVARVGRAIVNTGAFGSEGAVYANIAALQLVGPYNIPNYDTEGLAVYTNKQPCGAYRAPGTAEPAFAVESHMDMLAAKVGQDPATFRLKNAWEDGSIGPTGQVMQGIGLKDAIRRVADLIGAEQTKLKKNQGIGIACALIPSVGVHASGAYVKVNEDGSVTLVTGASDTGTGALSGLRMIVAEELGIPVDEVSLVNADTDFAPWDSGAQGSRTTYGAGNAVLQAAQRAKDQILSLAAAYWGVEKRRLELRNKHVFIRNGVKRSISLKKLMTIDIFAHARGGPIMGHGAFGVDWPAFDKEMLEGYYFVPSLPDPTFAVHAVLAEVDPETGKISLIKYVGAQDVGYAINPMGLEGQIEGGIVQGIGYALYEDLVLDDRGNPLNPSFADYKLATTMDVPSISSSIVEGHKGAGPYGAKGVGEANIAPPAPAIANAVYDAIGVRIHKLPLTPESVLHALDEHAVKK